jgi:hypothetical protein
MRFSLFFLLFLGNVYLLLGQSTPAAGDILFTHVDADADIFEFITLKRLNLNSLRFTDNGICPLGYFRATEDTFGLTQFSQISDVPCGTLIRVARDTSTIYSNNFNSEDGIVTIKISPLQFSTGGDQVISYIGIPANGSASCVGSGTNSFISGLNWGAIAGWLSSSIPSSNTSYPPGTNCDIEVKNTKDAAWFNGNCMGTDIAIKSTIGTGVRNTNNWSGTDTGTGTFLPLKNIQFHTSNYNSGTAVASSGGVTTSTLNLSGLSFSNTNTDTRYLVVMNANASPSVPANRYTCYTPNLNYGTAPTVVASVSTPPCSGTSNGNGKVVYFNYTLPGSLVITGLINNNCYNVQVYAINGNGYSANYSSTPANFNFFTGNLVSSLIAY